MPRKKLDPYASPSPKPQRKPPLDMEQPAQPKSITKPKPARPPATPRPQMQPFGVSEAMRQWHNTPLLERLRLITSGQAPAEVMKNADARTGWLERNIESQRITSRKPQAPAPKKRGPRT